MSTHGARVAQSRRAASAADRVRHVVDLAIRYGTITRTLARACSLTINLTINRGDPEELPHAD